jgi:hypothetical protein
MPVIFLALLAGLADTGAYVFTNHAKLFRARLHGPFPTHRFAFLCLLWA